MQSFVRFLVIESQIELSQYFGGKNGLAAAPIELYEPKLHHCYF